MLFTFVFVKNIKHDRYSALGTIRGFKGKKRYDETPVKGAAHAEDLCYVFK